MARGPVLCPLRADCFAGLAHTLAHAKQGIPVQQQPMVAFSLPLRPVERPVELPEEYRKTLRNECQVRYLESFGSALAG